MKDKQQIDYQMSKHLFSKTIILLILITLATKSVTQITKFNKTNEGEPQLRLSPQDEKILLKVIKFGQTNFGGSVSFSPDGQYALTRAEGPVLKLWDIDTGKRIREFTQPRFDWKARLCPDGKYIICGSVDGGHLIKLDVTTGSYTNSYNNIPSAYVRTVCISPDSKYALCATHWKTLATIDIDRMKITSRNNAFSGHTSDINSICFSPDGNFVVSGSSDKTLILWDFATSEEVISFYGHKGAITSVGFSCDGKYIISGSTDSTVRIWDVGTGKEIRRFYGHAQVVNSVCFNPDRNYAMSGSYDGTIKIWDILTGKEIRSIKGHSGDVLAVAFTPDGKYILSGSADGTIKKWMNNFVNIIPRSDVSLNEPLSPPILSVTNIKFNDASNNNRIDGTEECNISFTLTNKGNGAARNLKVMVQNNSSITGLSFTNPTIIEKIEPQTTQTVKIPISSTMDLATGIAILKTG